MPDLVGSRAHANLTAASSGRASRAAQTPTLGFPMHASSDIRIVKCLDGLDYSFRVLEHIHLSLHETCARIPADNSAVVPAIWHCWSFVDVVHRIRQIALAVPGLSKKNRELVVFLKATMLAGEYRNYIQHLRSELSKRDINPFPVWGSLAWVDPDDASLSHLVIVGAQVDGTSYTGCVFDTVEQDWVSRVCLGVNNKSLNFDPMFAACVGFREFVVPWMMSTYQPGIKVSSELPIISTSITVQGEEA